MPVWESARSLRRLFYNVCFVVNAANTFPQVWAPFSLSFLLTTMATLKRKAPIVFINPLLNAPVKVKQQMHRIGSLESVDAPTGTLQKNDAPELVKLRLGSPSKILGFDIETHDWPVIPKRGRTGEFHWFTWKDPVVMKSSRIVEIGWVFGACDPGAQIIKKSMRVVPNDWSVSAKAYAFHHISDEDARKGQNLEQVLCEFMKDVQQICSQGGRVCAHQFEFDAGIVYEELGRCGLQALQKEWGKIARSKGYCTMNPGAGRWIWQCLGREVGPPTAPHTKGLPILLKILVPKREDLYAEDNLHAALNDAEGTRLLYIAFLHLAGIEVKKNIEDVADGDMDDTQPRPDIAELREDEKQL